MLIEAIAKVTSAKFLQKSSNDDIQLLNFDSRKSTNSVTELFIALKGSKNDGHQYIKQLATSGIHNFLVSSSPKVNLPNCNVLLVEDTLQALQQIAKTHRSHFSFPVIGITGSNGKTIIKEWLSSILSEKYNVIKSPKSFNSQLGVPLSVWQINESHQVGVFEAGVSVKDEMPPLKDIIQPQFGIFTNIGAAHDEGFSSIQEKLEEKAYLFSQSEWVVCKYEHENIRQILGKKSLTWSISNSKADFLYLLKDESFEVLYQGSDFRFTIPLTSKYDLENIFHAVTTAIKMGLNQLQIQLAIDKIKPIPMRLELKRGVNDTYILDDSYNNDLVGLNIALEYLLLQPKKEKKIVILSDILQSGKSNEELYHSVNHLLKNHGIDQLVGIGSEISKSKNIFDLTAKFYDSTESFLKSMPHFSGAMILVKGARDYNLEQVVTYLEDKSHGTVLEVNNEAIIYNLNTYRKKLGTKTKLMVMVKAFAYGVGVNEIAHLLQYHRVDYLGVAYLDEAINLRRKGISLPIMIMNPEKSSFSLLKAFDLEPEIYSITMLKTLLETSNLPSGIHLKIETGMHRLGFEEEDIPELIAILKANPQVLVKGIFTHFSSSDDPKEDSYTRAQAVKFERVYHQITTTLSYQPIKHALNSSGIARWPQFHYDMVRLGIGLYGHDASRTFTDLRPISTLKSKVSQIKKIKKGDTIGYSRKGVANKDCQIATIAIGYADGYSRAFSRGNAYVLINGKKAPTIGNVCMDMTMVDVTDIEVKDGDEVIIFGAKPSIEDLARWANTIPYEILTNVSQRVKRVFVSE